MFLPNKEQGQILQYLPLRDRELLKKFDNMSVNTFFVAKVFHLALMSVSGLSGLSVIYHTRLNVVWLLLGCD